MTGSVAFCGSPTLGGGMPTWSNAERVRGTAHGIMAMMGRASFSAVSVGSGRLLHHRSSRSTVRSTRMKETSMSNAVRTELLSTGEVAILFGTKPETVAIWGDKGLLPMTRTMGGHRRFPADEIRAIAAVTPARDQPWRTTYKNRNNR